MRRLLLVTNPVAGKGRHLEDVEILKKKLIKNGVQFDQVTTMYKGHTTEIAMNIDTEKYTEIISVGGDGTLLEIINGCHDKDITIGILPVGSGNDYVKSIYGTDDPEPIIDRIVAGKTEKFDLCEINGSKFINVAGVGLDAEVLALMDKVKKLLSGKMAYMVSSLLSFIKYKSKRIRLTVDGVRYERDIMLCVICNGKYFGGGMMVAPGADQRSGEFDVVILSKVGKARLVNLLKKVYKGDHIGEDCVEVIKGRSVHLESDDNLIINMDGNLIGKAPLNATIEEKKLRIIY